MFKRLVPIYIKCLSIAIFFLFSVGYLFAQTTTVEFNPQDNIKEYHDTFEVEVWVNNVTGLHAFQTILEYDSDILDIVGFVWGNFLDNPGGTFGSTTPSDPTDANGTLQVEKAILGQEVKDGSGILYKVTFYAKAYGISDLVHTTASLRDINGVEIPSTAVDGSVTVNTVLAKVKVWLEGPYQAGGSMTTSLNSGGYIPLSSPYSEAPRTVSSIPSGVVDWVLVELRSSPTGSAVGEQSFFIKSDGNIVDIDGSTTDLPIGGVADGDYRIVIRHRNHLAVMTSSAQYLSGSSPSVYDFTTDANKYYGEDAKSLGDGNYGLYGGDANYNGFITAVDKNEVWRSQNGTSGYKDGDLNLDGFVTALDKNGVWRPNNGKGSQVP